MFGEKFYFRVVDTLFWWLKGVEFPNHSAAAEKGVFFVAAAGNSNLNINSTAVYPASYNMNNLIVTGSHTSTLQKASSANYGSSVDLSAQGASITVNDKLGKVGYAGGTSFAAPLVVSALSLYLGLNKNPNVTVNEVLSDLFNSSNNYGSVAKRIQMSYKDGSTLA